MEESAGEKYTSEDCYTAGRDIADAIRLEVQGISPKEQEEVRELAAETRRSVLNYYRDHISLSSRQRMQNHNERVYVLDAVTFSNFLSAWKPAIGEGFKERQSTAVRYVKTGDLIVLLDATATAEEYLEKSKRELFGDSGFNREEVIEHLKISMYAESLIHELIHAAQDVEKVGEAKNQRHEIYRKALDECGAYYIIRRILHKSFPGAFKGASKYEWERVTTFRDLMDKYGRGRVLDILFGNVPEGAIEKEAYHKLQDQIFAEFTAEKLVETGFIREDQMEAFGNLDKLPPKRTP